MRRTVYLHSEDKAGFDVYKDGILVGFEPYKVYLKKGSGVGMLDIKNLPIFNKLIHAIKRIIYYMKNP